ncbi:MAG: hypothetical protein ACR2HV_06265 [Acidimicrobiales bacterium]
MPSVEQVDEALECFELVVISNPQMLRRASLWTVKASSRPPVATQPSPLVVDESAIEFLPDPAAAILVGNDADNVTVLRSSVEFYGTAAACTGVAWSRDRHALRSLGHREALPVSGLDVVVAEAALAGTAWAHDARLAADAAWLDPALRPVGGRLVEGGQLPYHCIFTDNGDEWAAIVASAGIIVRDLGPGDGVHRAPSASSPPGDGLLLGARYRPGRAWDEGAESPPRHVSAS